jgi:hypothetical protein
MLLAVWTEPGMTEWIVDIVDTQIPLLGEDGSVLITEDWIVLISETDADIWNPSSGGSAIWTEIVPGPSPWA